MTLTNTTTTTSIRGRVRTGVPASWPGSGMRYPSAANVGYYTRVVEEHALRRGMLKASRQSTELATNLDTEVDAVLDQAEQRMLAGVTVAVCLVDLTLEQSE